LKVAQESMLGLTTPSSKTATVFGLLGLFSAVYFVPWQDNNGSDRSGDMSAFQKIAQNALIKAPAGPETTFGELWKDHRCVIIFFRRFG